MKLFLGAALVSLLLMTSAHAGNTEESEWQKIYAEAEKQFLQGKYGPSLDKAREAQAIAEKAYGTDSQQTAMSLSMIGVVLQVTGRIEQAETVMKQAMAMRQKVLGTQHADYAESLNNLAVLYRAQGRYLESVPLDLRALEIREKVLAPDHSEIVGSLVNLGAAYGYLGKFTQAETYVLRALALTEKKYGDKDGRRGLGLNNLAELYRRQGKFDAAEVHYLRAISVLESAYGAEHPNVAYYNNNLALLYFDKGEYSRALNQYQKSLTIFKKVLGEKHHLVSTTLSNIGLVYLKQGRYDEAEKLFRDALAIREATYGPSHPQVAASLGHLGSLYFEQSKFADAEAMHQKALPMFEKAYNPNHPDVAKSLISLALAYGKQGSHEQALPMLQRALAISEKSLGGEHSDVANGLNHLGAAYMQTGKFEQAEMVLERSMAIFEKTLGPEYSEISTVANNLAYVYTHQRKYSEAERLYLRAIAIAEKTQGKNHARVASNLNSLAGIYLQQKKYAKAEPLYQRSLSIWQIALGEDHYQSATALNNLSEVYRQQSRDQAALEMSRRTTSILRRRYGSANSGTTQGQLSEQKSNSSMFIMHLESLSPVMKKGQDDTVLAAEGFEVAQLARASSVGQSVAQMAARFAKQGDALAELVRAQQDTRDALTRANGSLLDALSKASSDRNADAETTLRQEILSLNTRFDTQNASIASRFPKYQNLISQEPVSVTEIQKQLAADEAMLVYTVADVRAYAWVVTRNNISFHPLPTASEEIEKQVQFLRSKLLPNAVGKLADMTPATSARLSQSIFAPMESSLTGIKHILLVADGALQSLPFGVLSTNQGGTPEWLAKRYAFSVLPSVSALRALRAFSQSETGKLPFAGFGDPVLTGDAGGTRNLNMANVFKTRSLEAGVSAATSNGLADVDALRKAPPLPETGDELRALSSVLNGSADALFLRQKATETLVKQSNLSDYRFLAFATHGVMAGELSGVMEPGLVLTPPTSGSAQDDGYLSASEVAQLKLNADWVLLSACNTAAPDGTPGAEGLSGLAKAFFYAGSRSLLVSNWPVASEATQLLVTDTVSTYAKTPSMGKAEAIKQAMGRMMENPKYAHPFYWGAFVVVGE